MESDQKNNGHIKSHPLKGELDFRFIIKIKITMKFAIALVAGLAQSTELQEDGIDLTLWDDGTFEVWE